MKTFKYDLADLVFLGLCCLCLGFCIGMIVGSETGFNKGQREALDGKNKYEKVYHTDSTYVKIK